MGSRLACHLEGEDPDRLDALLAAAERHGVVGWLWQAVRGFDTESDTESDTVVRPLRERHRQIVAAHLRTRSGLTRAQAVLTAGGVHSLAVKGPVLAEVVYPRPDLRAYADLDLLVDPAQFGRALDLLEDAGARLVERNWPLVLDRMLGQLTLVDPSGTVLDLHWHLLHERALWTAFTLPEGTAELATRTVEVGGTPVPTLAAEPALVHLALHAAVSGGHRLIWLADVDQSIRRDRPEWEGVVELAGRWSVGLPVALVLRRARQVLGAPVPAWVLTALVRPAGAAGTAWAGLGRVADRAAPVQRWRGNGSPARLISRATRARGPASAGELTRRAREAGVAATSRARSCARGRVGTKRSLFDPADPTSVTYPAGGGVGRRAYLDAVAAAGRSGVRSPCDPAADGAEGPAGDQAADQAGDQVGA